jgi:hypothetical protein
LILKQGRTDLDVQHLSIFGQSFGFEHGDLLAAEHPVDGGFGLRPALLGDEIDLFAEQFAWREKPKVCSKAGLT